METLSINATDETPFVELNAENKVFKITGRSLPEDARAFYQPISKWFNQYFEEAQSPVNLEIYLDYFNSSSTKQLVEIIIDLESLKTKKVEVNIVRMYDEDDELMETRGKEIESIVEIPFIFSPLKA